MGRTVIADEKLQAYVEGLLQSNTWYLGLIIGKLTSQKDYVIHMVRTPEPVEDQASDDDDNDDDSQEKTQKKPTSLESMNELWAATHAKQVTTMLTGGLTVVGVFAVAPPTMMQNAQAKLRQAGLCLHLLPKQEYSGFSMSMVNDVEILFAMYKQEKKSQLFSAAEISDRILLQICSSTRKITCRSIDVSDPKSAFRPADWKYTPISGRWTKLECDIALKVPINIPSKSTASIAKLIQTGLQPFHNKIENSLVLVDNTFKEESEMLDQSTDKKHSEKKSKTKDRTAVQQVHRCKVLSKMSDKNPVSPEDPKVTACSTEVVIKGAIHCRGFVTGKPTVHDAIKSIKQDVTRSVSSRCELLCDDLQLVEEDTERQEVYSTPRRVFFSLPGTSIDLCDYMFQDEKVSEVVKRIKELLDITVTEEDLDLTCEQPATEEDCSLYRHNGDLEEMVPKEIVQSAKNIKYYLMAGVGGVIGVLVAGFSYILSENT